MKFSTIKLSMFQSFKNLLWVFGLLFGLQSASAFSLLGPTANPPDTYQVSTIGYAIEGDIGAPKNLFEGYRRNIPVMYYTTDGSFFKYFGTNGIAAIDAAYAVFNALTNVDNYNYTDYSATGLFPFNTSDVNPAASALNLLDLKSLTMTAMMEQLGMAQPIRFTWCLKDRFREQGFTNQCPAGLDYIIIQRNFDPITWAPTNTVNNVAYGYVINELCKNTPPPESDADETTSTPPNFAVADGLAGLGGIFTGLTWDDVGGLRYQWSSNNVNFEATAPGSLLISSSGGGGTNIGAPFLLTTSDYTTLALLAQSTDPVTLSNLFPGLVITSSSFSFSNILVPNFGVVTNAVIGAPAGTFELVLTTNAPTPTIVTNYVNIFGNVIIVDTNNFHSNTSVMVLTVERRFKLGAPAGTLETVTNRQYFTLTNVPSGDYYISTNPCGPNIILSTLATNVTGVTNFVVGASTSTGLSITQSLVILFTNHVYVAEPIICSGSIVGATPNVTGLYEGVERIQFIRADYDSLLSQTFHPITNTYNMTAIDSTNNQVLKQTFLRVVNQPDFLFTVADLDPGPAVQPRHFTFSRGVNFNQNNVAPGQAGPGTIEPSTTITFNKVGPSFVQGADDDTNNLIHTDLTQAPLFVYGSFDATTINAIYPDPSTALDLANQLLVRISPVTLPNGTSGVAYPPVTFTTSGGSFSSPFSWSIAQGILPPGLTLSTGGTISGTPTQSGTFSFVLQRTDNATRAVQWNYTITIL